MYSVAIIEDNAQVREQWNQHFKDSTSFEISLSVDSVEKFLKYASKNLAIRVLILDINLSGISGIDGISKLKKVIPSDCEIIIYTFMEDYDTIFKAFTKGATGYLLKKMSLQRIEVMLLETIEEGGSAMSPQIARRMLKYFNPSNHRNEGFEHLTSSEEQILKFLIDGKTYNEIATLLNLSINGVKYHIKNLYQKLDVTSRHQLISIFK